MNKFITNFKEECRLTWLSSYMYISTIGNYCMTESRYHCQIFRNKVILILILILIITNTISEYKLENRCVSI